MSRVSLDDDDDPPPRSKKERPVDLAALLDQMAVLMHYKGGHHGEMKWYARAKNGGTFAEADTAGEAMQQALGEKRGSVREQLLQLPALPRRHQSAARIPLGAPPDGE